MQKENLIKSKSFKFKLKEKYKKVVLLCKKNKCTNFLPNYNALSHGRYSVVLLSKDKSHVVKVFYDKCDYDELKNELKLLEKLNETYNENIIKHLGYSYKKKNPIKYIKFEYCEGSELFCWEIDGLTDRALYTIMWQISSAVKHAHDLNIRHCDIKLENIFLKFKDLEDDVEILYSKDILTGRVIFKLGDWNLGSDKTIRGKHGTVEYMSPEVIRDKLITKKNDIWALGVVFYQLIHNDYPFTSKKDKLTMLLIKRYADGYTKLKYKESIFTDFIKMLLEPDISKRIGIDEVIDNLLQLKEKIFVNNNSDTECSDKSSNMSTEYSESCESNDIEK